MNKPKFPNKMIDQAYDSLNGKIITHSPTNQKFTDQDNNSNYDYHSVKWLADNNYLIEFFDTNRFVYLYKIK